MVETVTIGRSVLKRVLRSLQSAAWTMQERERVDGGGWGLDRKAMFAEELQETLEQVELLTAAVSDERLVGDDNPDARQESAAWKEWIA